MATDSDVEVGAAYVDCLPAEPSEAVVEMKTAAATTTTTTTTTMTCCGVELPHGELIEQQSEEKQEEKAGKEENKNGCPEDGKHRSDGDADDPVEDHDDSAEEEDARSDYSAASRVSADDLDELLCPLDAAAASRNRGRGRAGGDVSPEPPHSPQSQRRACGERPHGRPPPPPRTKHPRAVRIGRGDAGMGDATVSSMSSAEDSLSSAASGSTSMAAAGAGDRTLPSSPELTGKRNCGMAAAAPAAAAAVAAATAASAPASANGPRTPELAGESRAWQQADSFLDLGVDAFADLGVVTLRDEDEVEFGEGITMREEDEEQQITLGRDMFARCRNVAMIWGSTTSAVTPQASSSYRSAAPSSLASASASPASSTPSASPNPGMALAILPAAAASPMSSSKTVDSGAIAAVLRAVSILLTQPGARAVPFATAMRALAASKETCSLAGVEEALRSAAGVADGLHRRGGSAPPRPLPPAAPAGRAAPRWGQRPAFRAALPLPLAAAMVAAMFATAGDLSVRRAARDCIELRVDDSSTKLYLAVDLHTRRSATSDATVVDVRIRRVPHHVLSTFLAQNRKIQRAKYEHAVAEAEARWRALGCPPPKNDDPAGEKNNAALAAFRIVAAKGTFGVHQREAISHGDARRHTMV